MKSTVKRVVARLLDPFCIQLYFLFFSFFSEIPLLMAHVQFWKKIGLVWAALVILYDLFTRRRCLKSRLALPVFGLLLAYTVTTAVVYFSFPAFFQETYLDLFCSAVALLVLYPPCTEDKEQGLSRLRVLNWMLLILTTVVTAIGIYLFVIQKGWHLYSDITDYTYSVGFLNKRLTGLYRNAIYPTPLIGLMVAVLEWTQIKKRKIAGRIALALSALINVLHVILSNSRGNVYGLAFFAALVLLFLLRRHLQGVRWFAAGWKAWTAAALAAVLATVGVLELTPIVRDGCGYIPPLVNALWAEEEELPEDLPPGQLEETPDDELDEPVDMDRFTTPNYDVLTGRPVIWRQGIEAFLARPLLGYGPYTLKNEIYIVEGSTERISHFHNILMQSIVSVGTVGSVFFFTLLIGAAWLVLSRLLCRPDWPHYTQFAILGAMLASILLINMADVTLFFLSKNSEFVFWTYLGYAMLLLDQKPLALDRPIRFIDNLLTR